MTADRADTIRDAGALVRSVHYGDHEATRNILDNADLRDLAVTLAGSMLALVRTWNPDAIAELIDGWQQWCREHAAAGDGGQRP